MEIEKLNWVWRPNDLVIHSIEDVIKFQNKEYIRTNCELMIPVRSIEPGGLREEGRSIDPICSYCREDVEVISIYE